MTLFAGKKTRVPHYLLGPSV